MAKQLDYTDPATGASYPGSVWLPLGIFVDFAAPSARVEFLAYATRDLAAAKLRFAVGLPGGEDRAPIGRRSYTLTPDSVRLFALAAVGGPTRLDDLSAAAYLVAAETDGFFAAAADVDLLS